MDYKDLSNLSNNNDTELLSIILGTKPETIKEAVAEYNSVPNFINNYSVKDILKIKGLGKGTITKLEALWELYNRFSINKKLEKNYIISKPEDIYDLVKDDMKYFEQEHFRILMLNTKNIVINIKDIFIGASDSSVIETRKVFKEALKYNAKNITICHNHPSGDPDPSKEDINISLRIKEAGKIIGIDLLDHIIIGDNRFVSLKYKGII